MNKLRINGISSFTLHILAMSLMLCDHLWATLFPAQEWLTCIGRIAFPIFAFMIVEGYYHTSDVSKYMKRLLVFAIISEIPFNLIYGSSIFYPLHQNVLWTFLLALLTIKLIEKIKSIGKWWLSWPLILIILYCINIIGTLLMIDYFGAGILMILVFYFFHYRNWWCFLGQLICLGYINIEVLGGYYYPIIIDGHEFKLVQQSFALLALLPICLYKGKQGYHSRWFQYLCYAFYPAHLLIIYLIWQCIS